MNHLSRRSVLFILLAAGIIGIPARASAAPRDDPPGKGAYWVYLRTAPGGEGLAPLALSPRAIRRLEKMGRRAGEDTRDRSLLQSDLAPLTERGLHARHLSRWLHAASVTLTPAEARSLSADPRVLSVRPVSRFVRPIEPVLPSDLLTPMIPDEQEKGPRRLPVEDPRSRDPRSLTAADYGFAWDQLEILGVPEMHHLGYSGLGVLVALFDTGFNKYHKSLSGLPLIAERDFVCGDGNVGYDPGDPCDSTDTRLDTHGTYTWSALGGFDPGTHLGPAYRASFVLARTEDVDREVHLEEDNYIAALEWADSLGVEIISTSLGYRSFDGGSTYTIDQLDGETVPITAATAIAAERGMLVVTAMGNDGGQGASSLIAPADGKRVASIGAVDFGGTVASFSSRGPTGDGRIKPDVSAPGVLIFCASSSSLNSYSRASGTSLATPLVAGLCALLLEARPAWTPDSLLAALSASGNQAGEPNNDVGWGVPDGLRALGIEVPRLRVSRVLWENANGGWSGYAHWNQTGRLLLGLHNDGASVSAGGNLTVASDIEIVLRPRVDIMEDPHPIVSLDSSGVALPVLVPGADDSAGVRIRIGAGEGLRFKGLFAHISEGSRDYDRRIWLPVGRLYRLERFDVSANLAGTAQISWSIDLSDSLPFQAFTGVRLYRLDDTGVKIPLHEGILGLSGSRTDIPGQPGRYEYWMDVDLLFGFYIVTEGPREVVLQAPVDTDLARPYPNPVATGELQIPIAWNGAGIPKIDVMDVSGRRVRELLGEGSSPGYTTIRWDLKDDSGRQVSSGLYIVRLGDGATARVVVIRSAPKDG